MKTRGRPKKNINWPEGVEFTTKDIKEGSDTPLSTGLIHTKIKEALEAEEIRLVGKITGRL